MATLLNHIPSLVFPGEVNVLEFQMTAGENVLSLEISVGDNILIKTELTPSANGRVKIEDIASLVRDNITAPETLKISFKTSAAQNVITTKCLPAAIDVPLTATDFCKKFFLTRGGNTRFVSEKSQIPFTLFSTENEVARVAVVSVEGKRPVLSEFKTIPLPNSENGIVAFTINVADILDHFDKRETADAIEIEVGGRKATLLLRDARRFEKSVAFVGAFGQTEVVTFEHAEENTATERKMIISAGRRKVYHVTEIPNTTASAAMISEEDKGLYLDCISAKKHWLHPEQKNIVVTDAKMKDLQTGNTSPEVEIKFQTSSVNAELNLPPRIFDKSFGKTFN